MLSMGFARLLILLVIGLTPAWALADTEATPMTAPGLETDTGPDLPDALRPWVDWVLEGGPDGQDRRTCPIDPADGSRVCAWPGQLALRLGASGGRFAQTWELLAETWVQLPGDTETWPLETQADGRPQAVVEREGHPAVKLGPGRHRLTGRFVWTRVPDGLTIPATVALVTLERDGQLVPMPRLDRANRLWLGAPDGPKAEDDGDRLRLEVDRLIQDRLPLEVLTRLRLEVSGRVREVSLGPIPLPGGIPLRVESPLPARLEDDGGLRIQARPGRWELEVVAHHPGDVTELGRRPLPTPWPEQETWAFAAQPELRRVEPAGLTSIDPRQTGIPTAWASFPVYRVGPEDRLGLSVQVRGNPRPGPDRLRLERRLWLDFDGAGYSLQDRISGQLARGWRLDAGPQLTLGQVRVAGRPVLITCLAEDQQTAMRSGIEVRKGDLDLVADGRIESAPGDLPASGWALDFESVNADLELPPGWDLLMVRGVDNRPDSWVSRWTLLDLFLVLILTLGVARLWGWAWGLLALLALGLTWQEPGAPRLLWLNLLAAVAVLRLIPVAPLGTGLNRVRALAKVYFRITLLGLLVVGLPFIVSEVRVGLFPHLEQPWSTFDGGGLDQALAPIAPAPAALDDFASEAIRERAASSREEAAKALSAPLGAAPKPLDPPLDLIDPEARLQTGPGIPDWHWRGFALAWTGPVGEQESARLWLISPRWNLVLSLIGVVLLVLLGLRLSGLVWRRPAAAGTSLALLLALGVGTLVTAPSASAADLPSPALLEELRARLLEPPDCLPTCADLAELRLTASSDRLVLELTLDAQVAVVVPLPGGAGGWRPTEIRLDGAPSDALRRDAADGLGIALPAGRHQVWLGGPLSGRDQVEIPLPMTPRQISLEVAGWTLDGLDRGGRPGAQIRLLRQSETGASRGESLTQEALPPLLRLERTLRLGVEWRVDTRVRRLSPTEASVLIPVPLLPGESVQTAGVQVEGERVLVDLPAGRSELTWSSRLEPVTELRLTAATDPRLSEDWRLDVGELWHLEHQGPAPIHPSRETGRWLPTWRPLPGETLLLAVTRPAAVPGATLTLDRVTILSEPGQRGTRSTLALHLRASQGGSHVIRLPDAAEPISLSIDGRPLPLPDSTPAIEIPLTPGARLVELTWREPRPLTSLYRPDRVALGHPAVNLNLSVQVPDDRWVLATWGPRLGPAVLFWGSLLVLIGLAGGLSRVRLTPLRFHDWLLLGIGLMLAQVWVVLLVGGWLLALGLRQRVDPQGLSPWRFNLLQVGLVILTLLALGGLIGAVQQGLLGAPDMQIMGNGSTASLLNWYQDRGGPGLPDVWVLSVPLWSYRLLMLAWALWLAIRLLAWLRWGWEGVSRPMLWREVRLTGRVARSSESGTRS